MLTHHSTLSERSRAHDKASMVDPLAKCKPPRWSFDRNSTTKEVPLKPPRKEDRIAFTCTLEEDGAIAHDYRITDALGLMQWDGWLWDDDARRHVPNLTPMYSDLTLLSDPDLPDERAEAILKDFFDFILANRRQAVAYARAERRKALSR